MQKFIVLLLSLTFSIGTAFSQKTINDPNVEKRAVESFHGIHVGTGIELMLSAGSKEEVAVSAATEEYRNRIITKVENGILKIHYDNQLKSINRKGESKRLKAYVSYSKLDELQVTTGAEVKFDGVLNTPNLALDANTGASVDGEVNIGTLKVQQNTGSHITLTGKADKLEVEGSTGSKFEGTGLTASSCTAQVSTGANIRINAEKELRAQASTGGILKYKGGATILDIKTNSGGSIRKI